MGMGFDSKCDIDPPIILLELPFALGLRISPQHYSSAAQPLLHLAGASLPLDMRYHLTVALAPCGHSSGGIPIPLRAFLSLL